MLINKRETAALIDPAATENLIHPSNLSKDQEVTPSDKSLNLAAEEANLLTSGEYLLSISIQGKEYTRKFLVTHQLRHSLILGLRWLETEQAILDLTRHVLYVGHGIRVSCSARSSPTAT